jgi:PKD repeat protein
MDRRTFRVRAQWVAVALLTLLMSACGLQNQEQPSLVGPADQGLSIVMTATPDQLPRDGNSQSVITLVARDSSNRPLVGQRLLLELGAGSPAGSALSEAEVTTNSLGSATFAVSAPSEGTTGNQIVVNSKPVGTNNDNIFVRSITIGVNPSNTAAPTAAFTFSPAAPEINQVVTFDASTTTDEGVACRSCTFLWNFGGDGTASGAVVTHVFAVGGTYNVMLTAIDSAGTSGAVTQAVAITSPGIPTGLSVTASPANPFAKQAATFTAQATAAQNHRIVSYQFAWGDGGDSNTSSTPVIQHAYSQAGAFLLTLTVTDDLGKSASTNVVINVASGLTAIFTFAPANPAAGQTVTFNAGTSSSLVASTITDYAWDFDSDGTYDAHSSSPIYATSFSSGTWRVILKVTDNRGVTQLSAPTTIIVP